MNNIRAVDAYPVVSGARAANSGDAGLELGDFVRRASHDLANTFNTISINADLAKMWLKGERWEKLSEILDRLSSDCARCGGMIQGMQRFGSGMTYQPPEAVPVCRLIDAAINSAAQGRVEVPRMHRSGDVDARIAVDCAAFEPAIVGLLHNAMEAGATAIEVYLRRDGNFVAIEFRDNGVGIPVELRSRVVEAFFTTRRSEGHCGLGLTLAHELARRHGGTLTIDGNKGAGVCIELRLPESAARV